MAKMNIGEVASAYVETTMIEDHADEFFEKVEEQFGIEGVGVITDAVIKRMMDEALDNK